MKLQLATAAALVGLSGALMAQTQTISVPLNYNFNGCVHAGENGNPDDPNGYRSISDRGLDWTNGTPGAWSNYALVGQPGVLDCVHIGDRDQRWPFDPAPDGNNRGTARSDQIMDNRIRIAHRHAKPAQHVGGGALSHANGTSQTQDDHVTRSASI